MILVNSALCVSTRPVGYLSSYIRERQQLYFRGVKYFQFQQEKIIFTSLSHRKIFLLWYREIDRPTLKSDKWRHRYIGEVEVNIHQCRFAESETNNCFVIIFRCGTQKNKWKRLFVCTDARSRSFNKRSLLASLLIDCELIYISSSVVN